METIKRDLYLNRLILSVIAAIRGITSNPPLLFQTVAKCIRNRIHWCILVILSRKLSWLRTGLNYGEMRKWTWASSCKKNYRTT